MTKLELASALNLKKSQLRDKICKMKLTLSTRKKYDRQTAGLRAYKESRKFSEAEDEFVKNNYLTMNMAQMSKVMGRSTNGIRNSLERQNLNIPDPIIKANKQKGRFKKGIVVHNKGVKMPEATYEKVKRTMFKKGENRINASVELTENYLKWVIMGEKAKNTEGLPPQLINLKRAEIKINRELKNIKKNGKQ